MNKVLDMRKPLETVKIKILLGYIFLIGIASFTIWLIYSEVILYSGSRIRINKLNSKILYFNSVLTNLYQAESLERTYSHSVDPEYYRNYIHLMDVIYLQIDTLSRLSVNPVEKLHADSIRSLLEMKRKNLEKLDIIKKPGTTHNIYEQALSKLTLNRDSIKSLMNVHKTIISSRDSVYVPQKKKKFFDRLKYAFNPVENDTSLQITAKQTAKTDTVIFSKINPVDSVVQFLSTIMNDLKIESVEAERQNMQKEQMILSNDRVITMQLRRVLSIFEKDLLVNSVGELQILQNRIKSTTGYVIALGILTAFVIIIFILLILKDISRSQKYRMELEKAKAFSDSLLKTKEQIMLSLTHDIKTPLASVMGYAKLLNDTSNKEQKQFYLDTIHKSADHILKLINDLVDLTRIETGKLRIDHIPFNLEVLVKDIFAGFYPLATSKDLDFEIRMKSSINQNYIGDPVRLKQILGNIIANAIKYTSHGLVEFAVGIHEGSDNQDIVQFDVIDTGIGISQEDSKIIFNEFAQVPFNNTQRYDGAGLGLTIAQRIVSLLGGKITLSSVPGKGSHFGVVVPIEKYLNDSYQKEETTGIALALEHKTLVGKKILLIDDDEVFLKLTEVALEKSGFDVFACENAREALHVLDTIVVDIIITDIQMRGLSGSEMLRVFWNKTGKNIPVIAISGQDGFETSDFKDVKVAARIKKPFLPDELINEIDAILSTFGGHSNIIAAKEGVTAFDSRKPIYSLKQISQFASGDHNGVQSILISFIESTHENLSLLNYFLINHNRQSMSELSHKMLTMFRQLEADHIANLLIKLEGRGEILLSDEDWIHTGKTAIRQIQRFIDILIIDEKIAVRT